MVNPKNLEVNPKATEEIADPPMLLRTASTGGFIRANRSFRARVGFSEETLIKKPFLSWIDPADLEETRETLAGRQSSCSIKHRTRCGEGLPLEIRVADHNGEVLILARCMDDVEEPEGPADTDDEATVSGTLHTIARIMEDQNPGFKCSILLVADGRFVRGAGPSLPEDYNAAIDGFAVGPTIGSCGAAIHWNIPVIAEDIQADPLWASFTRLTEKAGVAACWSYPFASKTGRVLGALALYAPVPLAPTPEQLSRLKAAARMTGLAVERGRAEEAFRAKRKRELELEDQLRQAAKMEALGVLAGGVAHDFNNVLSTILGNAELALGHIDPESDIRGMLTSIVDASQRAGRFCQQMLAYAGRGLLKRSRIDIGAILPELGSLVQAALSKNTTLEYTLLGQPIYVKGDENQLLQVFMNLVINAAEAIGDRKGRIVVKSELAHYDGKALHHLDPHADLSPGEYVRLSVSDNGLGIDEKTAARIFDPFFTTKFTGRGLGLAAVKGIVSQHGGAIQIDSEVGKGTTFTVVLPTIESVRQTAEATASPSRKMGRKCILIADDEQALLDIICRLLTEAGFEVLTAADGQQAIEVFAKHKGSIDCVLLDFSMPRCSGAEAQQVIHSMKKDVPIVMMSGFSEHEVIDRFRGAGIAGCLQKPVTTRVLMETIKKAIAGDANSSRNFPGTQLAP